MWAAIFFLFTTVPRLEDAAWLPGALLSVSSIPGSVAGAFLGDVESGGGSPKFHYRRP